MNKIYKISTFLLGALFLFSLNSCSDDIDPEVTEVTVDQLFSPTNLEVRVQNQTTARVSWKAVKKAVSYELQFFANGEEDYSGSAYKEFSDILIEDLPFIVPGFEGETEYSVRVRAIGANITESRWTSEVFGTEKEQILSTLPLEDIQADQVKISWPAGEAATKIVLNPGNITYNVTAADVEAGSAIITGLTGETEYTAELFNGEKSRGTITFETPIDLGGAIQVNPEDDLVAMVEAAEAGDVFALMPGVYEVNSNIAINTNVSITGAIPSDKPVVIGAIFRIKEGGAANLKNLILDGTDAPDGNQTVVYDDDTDVMYPSVAIEDSEIFNYVKGIFYVSKKANIEAVTFKGNIIHDVECSGGDFIDFRQGLTASFLFENNTVYNSALARDVFRMDAGGSTNFPEVMSEITIKNNTFYNVGTNDLPDKPDKDKGKRFVYVRLASHEIRSINNIFAETYAFYSNQSATTIVEYSKNNYFNAPNFFTPTYNDKGEVNNHADLTESSTTVDPGFADPANGDFTISHEDLIFDEVGDPRWIN